VIDVAEINTENAYINKIPPHDDAAEQAVLGCMLFDIEGVRQAVESLHSDDFYSPANGEIFNAMYDLYNMGKPVDIVMLKNRLDELGVIDKVGGMEYIIQLADLVSTSANTTYYTGIVAEKATLRRLIKVSKAIEEQSYGAVENVDYVISEAENQIRQIAEKRKSEDFQPIVEVLMESLDKIEAASRSDSNITGIETGFIDFDRKTAGLQNTDLILIAARPSMGKTAFALNIAQYAATRGKVPTAIFSLEMSADQLVNRMLCAEALVDAQKMRLGNLTSEEWGEIARAAGILSEAPIYIDDTPAITPMTLRAKCRKLKLEKGLGLVVIDYLQLMDGSNGRRSDSQQQEVAFVSKSLKAIAKELEVPVIALSQLSRACESRQDKRPMMSDLRDSGAIEQDADMVCFLYRDEYYNPDTEKKNQAELLVSKHRNGSTGTVDLAWLGMYTKFANLEKQPEFDAPPFD
jgi:replicative DNA helicase